MKRAALQFTQAEPGATERGGWVPGSAKPRVGELTRPVLGIPSIQQAGTQRWHPCGRAGASRAARGSAQRARTGTQELPGNVFPGQLRRCDH